MTVAGVPSWWVRVAGAASVLALIAVALSPVLAPAIASGRPRSVVAGSGGPGILVLATTGLHWGDVNRSSTPAIAALAAAGQVAAVSAGGEGTTGCPNQGWLTLSSGRVAGTAGTTGTACEEPPTVGADGHIVGWADYRDAADRGAFRARLGTLGDLLRHQQVRVSFTGSRAALAIATSDGRVPGTALTTGSSKQLSVVDLGDQLEATGPGRGASLTSLDSHVAAVVRTTPPQWAVMLVSLGDTASASHLQVMVVRPPAGQPAGGLLTSATTRQPGLLDVTDVPATIAAIVGAGDAGGLLTGAPAHPLPASPGQTSDYPGELDVVAGTVHSAVVPFFLTLVLGQLFAFLGLAVWHRAARTARRRRGIRRLARGLGLVGASVPVCTFVANLVPWWRSSTPGWALVLVVLAAALVVGLAAWNGPWRADPLGAATAVCLVTATVLLVDVLAGSRLQVASLLGLQPLVGGRFFGVGNVALGVQVTALVIVAAVLGGGLLRAGKRWGALAVMVVIMGAGLAVDISPLWGAKVGAAFVLLPALVTLAVRTLGRRVRLGTAALTAAGVVVLLALFSVGDYLRGAGQRSHLGNFVATLIEGGAGAVVARKATQNVDLLLTAPFALLMPVGVLACFLFLRRPGRWRSESLARVYRARPELPAALVAILVAVCIGVVGNDTGVAIPPACSLVLLPLLVSIAAHPGLRPGTLE